MPNDLAILDDLGSQLRAALSELERRLDSSVGVHVEDLRDSFPNVWRDEDSALELVYAEYVLRMRRGEHPSRDDWYDRFPTFRDRLERLFAIYDLAGGDTSPNQSLTSTDGGPARAVVPVGPLAGYELLEELGRGGMGVVYKARQLDLNRLVALKMLRVGPAFRDETERIRREAEAIARVQHPNIVQIHAVGDADGVPFLCLEYVAGGSLADALAEAQRPGRDGVAPTDAARLIETLARAMHVAHQAGVVHRDLKPANVLLSDERRAVSDEPNPSSSLLVARRSSLAAPKITDFGLAALTEAADGMTQTGAIVGTPCYMAPEQAAADRAAVGPRTDVYALGGILYQMLTGRPPFEGATALETLELVRSADPVPPRRLRPRLPRDLETICLKCLRKEPAKRYASAAELADDLGRFLNGEPIVARPVSALERGIKWARRRPTITALAVVVFALVGTSIGLLWTKYEAAVAHGVTEQGLRGEIEQTLGQERLARADEQLASARAHWHKSDTAEARRLLDLCPMSHRGEAWLALYQECHAERSSVRIPAKYWGNIAPSPDGRTLALFQKAGTNEKRAETCLQLVDSHTAQPIGEPVTRANVWDAAFTADGRVLVMLSRPQVPDPKQSKTQNVVVWDVVTRKTIHEWTLPPAAGAMLGPDARWVAARVPEGLRIWNPLTGLRQMLFGPLPADTNLWVTPSADGRRVAMVYPDRIRVRDLYASKTLATIPVTRQPLRVQLSPDGRLIAWGTMADQSPEGDPADSTVTVWDIAGGREVCQVRRSVQYTFPAFSPNGQLLAVGDITTINLVDTTTGAQVATLRGHTKMVLELAFSSDGRRLYSESSDYLLKTWDTSRWLRE